MITVLFGSQRWRRRRAVARLGAGAIDPFGRPNFLYLTDTHRKRTAVARDFVGRDTFEPPGRVLGELFEDLWARWGDGRPTLTARALALIAWDVVESGPLAALGEPDAVGRNLATLWAALAEAHGRPTGLRPEVVEALGALGARADTPEHVSAPTALRGVLDLCRRPPAGLVRWLETLPPVVVDDVLQPSPLRAEVLLALLGALDRVGRPAVVAFESGGALDASDTALFFGGEDVRAHKAFAATRRLRAAVFERFVAAGGGEIVEARADGPVPAGAPPTPEPAQRPLSDAVTVARAPSVHDEVEHAAREVRRALDAGTPPGRLHVALADPERYRHVLVDAFARHGVPVDLADGLPLASTPPGTLLALIARGAHRALAPLDHLALADLRGVDTDALIAALPAAGVRVGPPAAWGARLVPWAGRNKVDPEPLRAALEAVGAHSPVLAGLSEARTPDAWRADWRAAAERLGVERLAERSDANRRAWGAACRAIDELTADLARVDRGPWPADRANRALAHAIRSARVLQAVPGAVPVTGVLELRGLSPARVWMLGLTRRAWPTPTSPSALVDAATRRTLAPVDRLAEARWLLGSLVRLATGDPAAEHLTLSWPVMDAGQPTSPSVVLTEWLAENAVEPVDLPADTPIPAEPAPRGLAGRLAAPPDTSATLPVTQAEIALRCPARHWYGALLDLEPHDPWDPELEPRRRGTAVHLIFQRFWQERPGRPIQASERDVAAGRLHALASAVLDEVEARGGFEPALQAWARDRWLAGLTDRRPKGLLAAWLDAEIDGGTAPTSVERAFTLDLEGVALRGTIDRVDRDPSGASRVVDYKTGAAPGRARAEAGLALQPLVYAEAVARADGGPVASAFQLVARPDSIRFTGWYGDPDAIGIWGGRRGMEAGTDLRAEHLATARERLLAVLQGDVRTTPFTPDLAGCATCRFARVCRVEEPC